MVAAGPFNGDVIGPAGGRFLTAERGQTPLIKRDDSSTGGHTVWVMFHRLIGMWVLRRAYRLVTADDGRPLKTRLTGEAKRILVGAAITFSLLLLGMIALVVLLIALAM